jgi:Asp-tRNA(Asn)/Glu-tRNA(Gln) amidotransferase B subunit
LEEQAQVRRRKQTEEEAETNRKDEDAFVAAVSALPTEEQSKYYTAWSLMETAERALTEARTMAEPFRMLLDIDERAASELEAQDLSNPIRKARAAAARLKATTAAEKAAQFFKPVTEAESVHAKAVKALEELRASLSLSSIP